MPNNFGHPRVFKNSYNKSYFTPPQGWRFLLTARQRKYTFSALTPQRRLKLLEVPESAAYLGVCEHFGDKADAERALLDGFF